jgi:hypothetical protein
MCKTPGFEPKVMDSMQDKYAAKKAAANVACGIK